MRSLSASASGLRQPALLQPWPTWRRFPQARTKPKLHSLIALVVTIIILVLVLGLLQYVLNLFPPPEPLGNVLRVVVVIIAVLVVIGSCSTSQACRSAAGTRPP